MVKTFKCRKPMLKMRKVDGIVNQDRISELPNNLIESILERISIIEAARTSILSTKWRYLWTKIPNLMLDKQFFLGLSPNKKTKSYQFVKVVETILMLHNGPIQRFDIELPNLGQIPNVDLWILYLSRNGVKELTFSNQYNQSYKLPSYIFSCDQLTYLSLDNCILNTPFQFTGFGNLRYLFLKKTSLSTITGSLISTLPSLVNLSLLFCTGVENIKILPPNLILFEVRCIHEFQWQWFQNKTKLLHFRIPLCEEVKNVIVQGKIFNLNSFLLNLPNLSSIELNGFVLKFLAADDLPEFRHHKLKQITLCYIRFDDLDQVSSALWLIKSSPNLKDLQIQSFLDLDPDDGVEYEDLSYIVDTADSDLKLNCLQSAALFFFTGLKAELAFAKLILSRSSALQQMKIESIIEMDDKKDLESSMQLMRFRRASSEAEIIYIPYPY